MSDPFPNELPDHFDLVVTLETLEHLSEEEGKKAIHNICALTDNVIFASTPDDYTEHTHRNVQQREYWSRVFALEGFFDDLTYRPRYITEYAVIYRRKSDWLDQVENYEKYLRLTEHERNLFEDDLVKQVNDKERHIKNLSDFLNEERNRLSWKLRLRTKIVI